MSDDNAYNRNVSKRMQEELAEFDTPQARYQQVLDRHWQSELRRNRSARVRQHGRGGGGSNKNWRGPMMREALDPFNWGHWRHWR
jgi:hypothetical protein